MSLNLDLTGLGAWELTYFQKIQGDAQNKRYRLPLIEPVEIPYLTDKHLFLVAATYSKAPPTWQRAGYLYQQIDGIRIDDSVVFEGLGSNNSTANLYVELGATATTSAFTARVSAGGYYEVPFTYTAAISGIWDAANGSALLRELT